MMNDKIIFEYLSFDLINKINQLKFNVILKLNNNALKMDTIHLV